MDESIQKELEKDAAIAASKALPKRKGFWAWRYPSAGNPPNYCGPCMCEKRQSAQEVISNHETDVLCKNGAPAWVEDSHG